MLSLSAPLLKAVGIFTFSDFVHFNVNLTNIGILRIDIRVMRYKHELESSLLYGPLLNKCHD